MNSPCKDCEERHQGCHSHCDEYQAYHAENMRRIEENRRINDAREYQYSFHDRYVKKTKGRKYHGK